MDSVLIPESQNGSLVANDSSKAGRCANHPGSDKYGNSNELLKSIHRTTSLGQVVADRSRSLQPGLGDSDDRLAQPFV